MLKDPEARITQKQTWNDYVLISISSPQIASQAQPGQFTMVRTSQNNYPLLRRPFSIFFADEADIDIFFQKVGIGTELLTYLTYLAKRQGLLGFTADVLADNRPMMALFEKGGFDMEKRRDESVYELKLIFQDN